jgi:putative permease
MISVIRQWFHHYFSDPQAVLLAILLISGLTILMTMSHMLAPVLASLVIAYLLEGIIKILQRWHIPRWLAIFLVFSLFFTLMVFFLLVLLPLLSYQASQFILQELPNMTTRGQDLLMQLPQRYPEFISPEQIDNLLSSIRIGVKDLGQYILSYSLASIPLVITLSIYLILVPLLVFFFLKDKEILLKWLVSFLPKEHAIAKKVWLETDVQMGNYIRGKVNEIFIVAVFTYIPFAFMELHYAPLLAVLNGLSVIIPYVGAIIVTIPIVLMAYFQWGLASDFWWLIGLYLTIQVLDGNILVPILFSEAVNLHPIAIIVAVLVFGGIWGFWGIFFAIPLATLVKALLSAWPRAPLSELGERLRV